MNIYSLKKHCSRSDENRKGIAAWRYRINGDMVCLQVRVITPYPEEKVPWVGDFMEDICQILNLYSRIISLVADELKVNLGLREDTLLADSRIVDPDAYDACLKGKSYLDGFNPESWYVAIESFEKAFEEMKKKVRSNGKSMEMQNYWRKFSTITDGLLFCKS